MVIALLSVPAPLRESNHAADTGLRSFWHGVTSPPPSPWPVFCLQDEHGVETQPTRMAAHAGNGP